MMKQAITSLLLLLTAITAKAQIKAVDRADGSPVQYASVFLADGTCIGTSDKSGVLPLPKGYSGMVTIQHINYGSHTFNTDTVKGGTVLMSSYTYSVPEAVCSYARPDYMVISAYARSYQMADSVPASFLEGMYDFYIPMDKGRARRKIRWAREVFRTDLLGDNGDYFLYTNDIPKMNGKTIYGYFKSEGWLNDSTGSYVIGHGKRGIVAGVKRDTAMKTLEVYYDSIFTADDLKFGFLGLSMRLTDMSMSETYHAGDSLPRLRDLLRTYKYQCHYDRFHGKKKPEVRVDEFNEVFVTGISYASKQDMKAALKDKTYTRQPIPDGIPPLSQPLTDAIERMKPRK